MTALSFFEAGFYGDHLGGVDHYRATESRTFRCCRGPTSLPSMGWPDTRPLSKHQLVLLTGRIWKKRNPPHHFQFPADATDTTIRLVFRYFRKAALPNLWFCGRFDLTPKEVEQQFRISLPALLQVSAPLDRCHRTFRRFDHTCSTTRFDWIEYPEKSNYNTPPVAFAMRLFPATKGFVRCFSSQGRPVPPTQLRSVLTMVLWMIHSS
mmetsp:Transcript_22520/g.55818  ORF Transcript_22520/g.55818 Transcript_22520/m.55818 type:complete len:208 (-) Transcript_22520:128-751(-)